MGFVSLLVTSVERFIANNVCSCSTWWQPYHLRLFTAGGSGLSSFLTDFVLYFSPTFELREKLCLLNDVSYQELLPTAAASCEDAGTDGS